MPSAFSDSEQDSVETDLSRVTIEKDWSELAIDDGSNIIKANDYALQLISRDAESVITTPVDSLRFRDEVNAAQNPRFEIPPHDELVEKQFDFLSGSIYFFVSGDLAFAGEITKIESSQNIGENISIKTRNPGQRAADGSVDFQPDNTVLQDVMAKMVDRTNDVHSEMADEIDNAVLDGVEVVDDVVLTTENSGSIRFNDVHTDASEIKYINIKSFSEPRITLRVYINDEEEYSIDIEDSDANNFGEWSRIGIPALPAEAYDLEFEIEGGSFLFDWISIASLDVTRTTIPPEIETTGEDEFFYDVESSDIINSVVEDTLGDGLQEGSDRIETRQVSAWARGFPKQEFDTEFENGEGSVLEYEGATISWSPTISDPMDEWGAWFRYKVYEQLVNRNSDHTNGETAYDDDWDGAAEASTEQVAVEDSSVKITGDAEKSFQWTYRRSDEDWEVGDPGNRDDFRVTGQGYVTSTSDMFRMGVQAGSFQPVDNEDGYGFRQDSDELELIRYDDGSTTTLDTTSMTAVANEWFDWEIEVGGDGGVSASISNSEGSWSVSDGDHEHIWFGEFFVDTFDTFYIDDILGEVDDARIDLEMTVDNNSFDVSRIIQDEYREWEWRPLIIYDFSSDFPKTASGTFDLEVEALSDSNRAIVVSPICIVPHTREWDSGDFDTEVHEPNGHLDYPPVYSNGEVFDNSFDFESVASEENIFQSTTSTSLTNTDEPTGQWGPSQRTTDTAPFLEPRNKDTVTDSYPYTGVDHQVRMHLSGAGSERNDDSPRFGYQRMAITAYEVTISTNDLEIVFDQSLTGNRLSVMSELADDSSYFFRWEGNNAHIFQRGAEKTDPELRSEEINSSVGIEDVYSSAEVFGFDGIRSGVIEAKNPPEFIDRHKEIRDQNIETELDARRRAIGFLRDNSTIEYEGNITTLPTFAPVGALIDGEMFNHGEDMVIESIRYGKRRTTIELGFKQKLSRKIRGLNRSTTSITRRQTTTDD